MKNKFFKRKSISAQTPSICVFTEGMDRDSYGRISLNAFYEGVRNAGDNVRIADGLRYEPCDIAVIFGDVRDAPAKEKRMRLKAEIKGRHIHRGLIVIDTSILTRSTSIGKDYRRIGLDGILRNEGNFVNSACTAERWESIKSLSGLSVKPWRERGDFVLFALQRPVDASLKSTAMRRPEKYKRWVLQSVETLRSFTDRQIVMRPHPASLSQNYEKAWLDSIRDELGASIPWGNPDQSFHAAIENCWACVSYNSGAGVDAALSGIPVFTGDSGSFAWDIANHDLTKIENPSMPERSGWLHNLSYVEWSLDEMKGGAPWRHLKNHLLDII